jgi:hypothetical protein
MSIDGELFEGIPKTVAPRRGMVSMPLPAAWQATADNRVTRHYTGTDAAEQAKVGKQRINDLRTRLVATSATIDKILREVDEMDAVVAGAPSEELATAEQALIDLQNRNDNLIRECRRWKQRATTAEKQAEEALEKAQKQAEMPDAVHFLRGRTPGDSVRYLAGEAMKHAGGNLELAGVAIALKMVAADVDNLPQGQR